MDRALQVPRSSPLSVAASFAFERVRHTPKTWLVDVVPDRLNMLIKILIDPILKHMWIIYVDLLIPYDPQHPNNFQVLTQGLAQ